MSTSRHHALTVHADVDRVWESLAAFGDIGSWAANVDHSCVIERSDTGEIEARRVQVGRQTIVERIAAWEPPARLAYRLEGLPARLGTITNEWKLAAAGPDTEVTLTTTVDAGRRPPARLVEKVISRKVASESESLLAGLAEQCTRHRGSR